MLCCVSRDIRRKDFQSSSMMSFVSSRIPSVLKKCIKSQKPGYLVGIMHISRLEIICKCMKVRPESATEHSSKASDFSEGIRVSIGYTIPVRDAFQPQNIRHRYFREVGLQNILSGYLPTLRPMCQRSHRRNV